MKSYYSKSSAGFQNPAHLFEAGVTMLKIADSESDTYSIENPDPEWKAFSIPREHTDSFIQACL